MEHPSPEPKRDISSHKIVDRLRERFGADQVRLVPEEGLRLTSDGSRAVISPASLVEVSEILAFASSERWRVIPMGAGSWLDAGNPPTAAHVFLSTERMNRVLEYEPADLTATVEAGCTLSSFNAAAAQNRQTIPLDPFGSSEQTLGAIVATASYGTFRCGFGTPRDWVIGMRVAHSDGRITKAGGKVVKNVAGYDLCKLYTGSFGTLGVIGEMSFKLRALPSSDRTIICHSEGIEELFALAARIVEAELQPASLEMFSPAAVGVSDLIAGSWALAVRFIEEEETIESEAQELAHISGGLTLQTLSNEETSRFWSAYPASETAEKWVWSLRISVLPTDVPRMAAEVRKLMPSSTVAVHAANGVLRVFDETQALDQLKTAQRPRKVAELRRAAQERGGQLVILRAPDSILEKLDVWGEVGQPGRLMRELKSKYDPQSILNPGRFVNGI
jgi:glycolate oxidase FAD binding subunit